MTDETYCMLKLYHRNVCLCVIRTPFKHATLGSLDYWLVEAKFDKPVVQVTGFLDWQSNDKHRATTEHD
jgi:hypothetical protein